ncbi:MAG: HAMP domain-containing protein [Sphingomonadales bacterium]|nr:HAMP domain-containing protein [Sphingomonadales bacterium]MBD3772927.1 HAMP domain-containing protein [Paracoccaceae bacterium]
MKGSLLRRNLGLLVSVVLAGQLLAGVLVLAFVLQPQTVRVADISARMLDAVSVALEEQHDPASRARIVAGINSSGNIQLRPLSDTPDAQGSAFPNFLERLYMHALARRLHQQEIAWRTDGGGHLWLLLELGGEQWWVNMTPPRIAGPLLSLVVALLVAFIVAVAGGYLLQRRLNRPLGELTRGVASFQPGRVPQRIVVEGPSEIASVAHAFNDMADRIAAHESERALMLAGVSHDLRTPLARLRLSVEMMPHDDEELRESAQRQIEHIDRMLGQFLDYARDPAGEPVQEVALAGLAASALEDAGMAGAADLDIPSALRARVRPQALCRAIRNLLENARRYGAAPYRVQAAQGPEGIVIAVEDSGTGFDPALAAQLLKPFAKADSARSSEGTGLGLAIAERIVRSEGGAIRFRREDGRFRAEIVLPAVAPAVG